MLKEKTRVFAIGLIVVICSCKKENSDRPDDAPSSTGQIIEHLYTPTQGPDKNPMKGWNSGWWADREYASVGFQYLGWKSFEPADNVFNYEAIEDLLEREGTRNKHFILRLYCDWFGENEASNAGPEWLYSDLGVARLQNEDGRYVTDYNDPVFIEQAIEAIQALAAHFEDDPRAYSFQIGILGFWGEWHNAGFGDGFSIHDDTKIQILQAYKNSFDQVRLMGRYPWREPLASSGGIGFHNDFFGPNGHSDEFDESVQNGNKWLDGPIGGEAPPNLNQGDFDEMFGTNRGLDMIETGHYATMLGPNPCADSENSENCQGFMDMHRRMGYNYQIESAHFAENLNLSDELTVEGNISNTGVAPIYYNWQIQLALLDTSEQLVKKNEVEMDLTSVLPETSFSLVESFQTGDLSRGNYQLAIRIIQPGADQPKSERWKLDARNTYILFASDVSNIEGVWDDSHRLVGGWSLLGNISVE